MMGIIIVRSFWSGALLAMCRAQVGHCAYSSFNLEKKWSYVLASLSRGDQKAFKKETDPAAQRVE